MTLPEDTRLRDMTAADIAQVLEIERASFPTPWSEGMFTHELVASGRSWIVADRQGEVVGYAGVMVVYGDAHIMNLAVKEDARRSGIGRVLFDELRSRAIQLGGDILTLEVRPSNDAAIALYESEGLKVIGMRPGYYADTGEAALIMSSSEPLGARAAGPLILAIETSCDETAAAVMQGTELRSSVVASQVDFHARFGGVVPEIASRKHVEAIVAVVDEAVRRAEVTLADLAAVAATNGPGLVGALVVGLAYAKALAYALEVPLVGVNHLEGHIFANILSDPAVAPPLIALVVSGGHTSLLHMPDWGVYHTLGETLDDAAGEAFDKVAKVLGLGYPGGPILSRLAAEGDPAAVDFPRAMLRSGDYAFSLSGLKTAVINHIRHERAAAREINVPDLAASFQAAIIDVQVAKAIRAVEEYQVPTFCLAGGVAANAALREALRAAFEPRGVYVSVPPLVLCTDNAAMIAAAAQFRLRRGETLGLDAEADPSLRLDSTE
jgi:tRNA threonylcarbamoyl adenosine modification protein TsaD/ribosomal-protein-alanine acetyltransferase